MSNVNWLITGNENEGNNKANKMNMNGTLDLARLIVEIEQKLERTLNSRLDVLQSQMAQFDRKLYFIEMKLDTLNQFFGTEMPQNEFNYMQGGRTNNNRNRGGNNRYKAANHSTNNLQIFGGGGGGGNGHGRYGEGDGPTNGFEADLTMEERLISKDFVPPALRFLFAQFSTQNEDGNTIRSSSSSQQRTTSMTAFYDGNKNNENGGGGGQHRRFAAASSANFSAQMAASIGYSNGPTAFNGNKENGGGGGGRRGNGNGMEQLRLSNGNGMEQLRLSNGNGNGREQQLDGGFGQGRKGPNLMMRSNNHQPHQQWSPLFLQAMAETKGQKGGGGQIATAANRAAIKQKQTLGKGTNNKIAEWTTRSMMGSYTMSEESEESDDEVDEEMEPKIEDENGIEEEKKSEDDRNEVDKIEKKKNEKEEKEKQIMNGVNGKHIGEGEAAKNEGTKIVGRRNSI